MPKTFKMQGKFKFFKRGGIPVAANRIKGITIEIGGDPKEMIPAKNRLLSYP